jgi:hypothetical protein
MKTARMLDRLRRDARYVGRIFKEPIPARFIALRFLNMRFRRLSYASQLEYGLLDRAHYGHCLLQAAILARRLGHDSVSAIEFGVAGGNGLMALEDHAERVEKETGVRVAIYGFDTGTGMPKPVDHRDMPYLWQAGYFAMDVERLRARLRRSKLILGPVEETAERFCRAENPPPIGFISFDLDYYSSTVAAFRVFAAELRHFLPRVACYFDDTVGDIDWAYNEFTGELLAIREFNDTHDDMKIAPVRGLRHFAHRIPRLWHEQIFVAHLFRHLEYGTPISEITQLPLA